MGNLITGMVGKVLAGQVRTLLAVGGGFMVARGMDADAVNSLQSCLAEPVVGLVLTGLASLWSAKAKVTLAPTVQPVPDQAVVMTEPALPKKKYPN